MKWNSLAGRALGFLAGTTLGSGIGFLFHWQSYNLVVIVSALGVLGAILGGWTVKMCLRNTSDAS
ncbi:hypothetical protein [Paenibacillus lentus]|uniref:Uncharacterized protein n=1 Tax=Paenibacillus lentus TaxID=1338368 RepID=A0A3S8RYT1_9BACL|nr:hypothetical protein [Paenibacillus lentus]AZK48077.1 hypothetical protein EIM92_19470 [Paenibacillus lentus]